MSEAKVAMMFGEYKGRMESKVEGLNAENKELTNLLIECASIICTGYHCHKECMCSRIAKALGD